MDVPIACICPPVEGAPRHPDGDTVTLHDRLDFRSAVAIRNSLAFASSDDESGRALELLSLLTEAYVLFGVASWTVLDDDGKPVLVTHHAVRQYLLDGDVEQATAVAEVADNLYSPTVLLPLVQRASRSSPRTPTNGLTSAPKGSPKRRRTPSSPSSISTTQTGATGTTTPLRGGASNTSPSAVLVE